MPRRSMGGASNDPSLHDVRQEMARLPLLSRTAMVRAGDTSPTGLRGVSAGEERNGRVWSEIRMARADGRWRPYLPRQQPESADTKTTTSEGRLRTARTISAWQPGWGPARSDGRARKAPERSYLAVMRRSYQRERPILTRTERTLRRVRTQISPVERPSPSVKDARAPRMSSDLSRRGIRGHGSEQDDYARSENRRPLRDERGQRRCLRADLICDDDQTPDALPVEEPPGWDDELPAQGRASPRRGDRPCRTHVQRTRAQFSPVERSRGSGTQGLDKAWAHRWRDR